LADRAGKIPGQAFERTVSFIILMVKNQGYFMTMQTPMLERYCFATKFTNGTLWIAEGKA